ncbi:hypothetical protein Nepgr_026690 [Nepenthes gracilis]|uniref:Uncharacterized protein n=1 Tax=Nepenthes gracilis TaxID=150966 RepID=A0AAD3T8P1_NEPGR|nr:hypothetical protein Nepgr_026690 [Nepenthes gracilis]
MTSFLTSTLTLSLLEARSSRLYPLFLASQLEIMLITPMEVQFIGGSLDSSLEAMGPLPKPFRNSVRCLRWIKSYISFWRVDSLLYCAPETGESDSTSFGFLPLGSLTFWATSKAFHP